MIEKFVKTVQDKNNDTGLNEWKAIFAKEDLAKAFASAAGKPGLKAMGGVVPRNRDQVVERMKQLGADPEDQTKDAGLNPKVKDTVKELRKGLEALDIKMGIKHVVTATATATVKPLVAARM